MLSMARSGHGLIPAGVPTTSFNGRVGHRRRLGTSSLALQDVKAVKQHFGVTVNDVLLAVVAGALRTYLEDRGELPERSLVTGVPLSTRGPDDDDADNKIAMMAVSLATDVEDPADRLMTIHAGSQGAKEMTGAVRATEIPSVGTVAPPVVLQMAIEAAAKSGLASRAPTIMNTLVSNVPGPPFPLYLAGGRVTGIFSTSIIMETMGLNITVFSYMDRVDFGLHVDPDLVPEPGLIARALPEALAELMLAAGLGTPTPVEDPLGRTADRA